MAELANPIVDFSQSVFGPLLGAAQGLFQSGTYALSGNVSPGAKQDIVNQEAKDLVQASGGTISLEQATAVAQGDVTTVLTQAGADPSQAPWFIQTFGTYLNWAVILLALFLAYKLLVLWK